jgi:hypothetical protein
VDDGTTIAPINCRHATLRISMKSQISLGLAALALTASSAAFADVHVDINPFGYWGAPPPVVYAAPRYYAPPVVYAGRGHWGHDDRGRHDDRGHRDDRHR